MFVIKDYTFIIGVPLYFYCVNLPTFFRVTLALRVLSDHLDSKEKKDKVYENLKMSTVTSFYF